MNLLFTIGAFILAIGVLVTVHEFGHFWAARSLGVKVLRFSIGFGRALWRRAASDGTEYVIAAVPLGGYVKMLDEREGEVPAGELDRAFNRKPLVTRTAVVLAGPLFNFLFALLAYWAIYMIGVPGIKPVIGPVGPDSPAAEAGFRQEDEISRIDGDPTPTWEAASLQLLEGVMSGSPIRVTVTDTGGHTRVLTLRGYDSRKLTEPGALLDGLGLSRWEPPIPPVIGSLSAGGPAASAGLEAGDRVLEAGGSKISDWRMLVKIVQSHPDQPLRVRIQRKGEIRSLTIGVGHQASERGEIGHIGAGPRIPANLGARLRAEQRYNPLAAFGQAVQRTGSMSLLTLEMVWKMIIGDVSWRNISGPINIAQYAGYTASAGLVPFLAFLAIVSVSLGVINLLPVPVLDGGHLLYYGIELVQGRPVSAQTELLGQKIGIALLFALMSFAIYNDLSRILG